MDDKHNISTLTVDEPKNTVELAELKNSPSPTYELIRQKWREYLIEILVIIFSITISFALNAWKEKQSKSELEGLYLKSLYNDISSDIEALQETIHATKQVVGKAKSLLAYSRQEDLSTLNGAHFLLELRGVFDRPNFVSNDATFTDLKSSGNMQVLTSFPLKNSLFKYYKQYEAIKAIEIAERDATLSLVAPYIMKRFSLSDQPLDSSNNTHAMRAVLKDTEYINCIFVRLSNREELLEEYKNLLIKSQKIKVELQKQIK
jgi:hypothetical protein